MAALVLLVDVGDGAVLSAAKQGLLEFATALCLHQPPHQLQPAASGAAAPPPPPRAVLGLCNLCKPPNSLKHVLQVRYRPGPFVLRDFHAAVGRLAHPVADGGSGDGATGATAAAALQQVVSMVAQDAACAAGGGRRSVLYLTDALSYEPEDFGSCLEVCRSKGVHVELLFMAAGQEGSGGDDAAADAAAAAWQAAEAAFPHLSVTVVRGASKASFDALASTLAQRYAAQPALAVSLQFKQPLVGALRSLPLTCCAEVRPLAQAVDHALLCPCHQAPAYVAGEGAAAACSLSGAPLDRRQCRRDERTVVVGRHPAGALHLAAPFNIASLEAGAGGSDGSSATLSVMARVKAEQANPALLFGVPLLLSARQAGQAFKVVADGEMADVSTCQLLRLVCSSLSSCGEALLASSCTDLESGRAGLFRLHYLLLPCQHDSHPPALCAKRVACAEELLAPMLPAAAGAAAAAAGAPAPAVAEVVGSQLARVPLQALDPLALSSRCSETVEMLVRESQPLPRAQAPAAPAAQAPPAAQVLRPATAPPPADAGPAEPPAQPSGRGRRPAAAAPAAGAGGRGSAGRAGVGDMKQAVGGGKGALEFKRRR